MTRTIATATDDFHVDTTSSTQPVVSLRNPLTAGLHQEALSSATLPALVAAEAAAAPSAVACHYHWLLADVSQYAIKAMGFIDLSNPSTRLQITSTLTHLVAYNQGSRAY
jgi:hypothetical protein